MLVGRFGFRRLLTSALVMGAVLSPASGPARAAERKDAGPYCGLYCAYAALHAIGVDVAFETLLRPRYLSSRQGSSVEELRQAVIGVGVHAIALEGLGAESLRAARGPMILHVASDGQLKRYNHWLVFLGMHGGKARVLDPPNSMEIVPISDVLARWNGTALVVSDKPIEVGSVAVFEGAFYLNVILLAILIVWIVDHLSRRLKIVVAARSARPVQSAILKALVQGAALGCCTLALVLGFHAIDDVGFLRNPAAARYVAAADVAHFFPRLSYQEVRRFVDEQKGYLIDARLPVDFALGRIPGAINVPVDASPAERRETMARVPRDASLLVYCQSDRCEYNEYVAALLARDGFGAISLYRGGWVEWDQHEPSGRRDHK